VDHPRPWEDEELMDRSSSYRSSVGRSVGTIPSYNGEWLLFLPSLEVGVGGGAWLPLKK
jgi:hypothetical protein